MKPQVTAAFLLIACLTSFAQAELWVDGAAPGGGDGSAEKPFQTINDALKVAIGGDTITLHKGTYAEVINLKISGTPARPTILRGAPGERVILSGFASIADWKPETNGVYTATVESRISDLYVGFTPQLISCWPALDQPMRHVKNPDVKANTFQDLQSLASTPLLKEVATSPKSAVAFLSVGLSKVYSTFPIAGVDAASNTITLVPAESFSNVKGQSYRYQLINHPSLIQKPGEWAFEKISDGQNKIYFKPANPEDLKHTQYRQAPCLLCVVRGVKNIRLEGLEVCGSASHGIQIEHAGNITVDHCLLHSNRGIGLWARHSANITFKDNISVANGFGMSLVSSRTSIIEGNEIAFNLADGISIAGNTTGEEEGEPDSADITVRNNYDHHHLFRATCANLQCSNGVNDLKLRDNVLLFGMQGAVTHGVHGGNVTNCVILGAGIAIFGDSNSENWTVANSTLGLGGAIAFSLTGKDYRMQDNLVWNNTLAIPQTFASDYNLFYFTQAKLPTGRLTPPKDLMTVADITAATGQERHSQRTDPRFKNVPCCQIVADGNDANRVDHLVLRLGGAAADMTQFANGDAVEINGDGVLRRVTTVGRDSIDFQPVLPMRPFRGALIWNWKQAISTTPDLRFQEGSPGLTGAQGGKLVGATLDLAAYQRGEFYGDGKRAIPPLPEDVKAALPNPNQAAVPLYGQ